jgi:hypothetical protein
MVPLIASVLSVGWMLIAYAMLCGYVGVEEGNLLLPIALDLCLLLVGIFAVIRAIRRRQGWILTVLICFAPLFHAAGALVEYYRPFALFVPSALIVVLAISEQIKRLKHSRKDGA